MQRRATLAAASLVTTLLLGFLYAMTLPRVIARSVGLVRGLLGVASSWQAIASKRSARS
jgi:hypothetical protein